MAVKAVPDTPSDVVAKLLAQYNQLQADTSALISKFNSLLSKLDADTGVADTNYSSTLAATVAAEQVSLRK